MVNQTVKKWAIWTGIECEGRLAGVPTVFFYCRPENAIQVVPKPSSLPYTHFYFCKEWISGEGWEYVRRAVLEGCLCSVELLPGQIITIPADLLPVLHLVVTLEGIINADQMALLKPTDALRLTPAPFLTYSIDLSQAQATQPNKYTQDVPLFYSTNGQERP